MFSDASTLPDDPVELKKILARMRQDFEVEKESLRHFHEKEKVSLREQYESENERLQNRYESLRDHYEEENELLREQIRQLFDKLFGRKSEKLFGGSPQLLLFDMPEPDPETEPEEQIEVVAHRKSKPGRKPLPQNLPRVEVVHDIAEEEKQCGCGAELSRIGEEVSEKLDLIPAVIRVIRHIRPQYSCKSCEGVEDDGPAVRIAPVPPQIIPKGIASGGLLAHILTAKFEDALPFYRQEKQFARLGVELNRATMCNWAMKAAEACQPLLTLLHQDLLSGPLINIDETTVQVLAEPGRSPTTKSFMWIFRGGDPQKPSIIYQYSPTRSGDVAAALLGEYQGCVQTDGYGGYDFLDTRKGITHLGCWAHVRRKFMDAQKAGGGKVKKSGSADVALSFIRKLYGVEKKAKSVTLTPDQRVELRRQESLPVLENFRIWLEKKSLQVVPKSLLGKAVSYALSQWARLVSYVEHGVVTPDNNLAENCIRPFVVGRKNWLFAGTPDGASASAAIYSLIETAKACGLDVYRYLRFLFENIPFAGSEKEYRKLMPHMLTDEQLALPKNFSVV